MPVIPVLGKQRLGILWTASLAELVSPGSTRGLFLRNKVESAWERHLMLTSSLHIHVNIYMHICAYIHINIYMHVNAYMHITGHTHTHTHTMAIHPGGGTILEDTENISCSGPRVSSHVPR